MIIAIKIVALLYLLIGVILWQIGIKTNFGDKQGYKEYLKEIEAPDSAYFYCPIIFVFAWPIFIKRKGDDDEE